MNIKCPECKRIMIFAGGNVKASRAVEFYHCNSCDKDYAKKEEEDEKKLILIKIN